jgi:hypothetical protein
MYPRQGNFTARRLSYYFPAFGFFGNPKKPEESKGYDVGF